MRVKGGKRTPPGTGLGSLSGRSIAPWSADEAILPLLALRSRLLFLLLRSG